MVMMLGYSLINIFPTIVILFLLVRSRSLLRTFYENKKKGGVIEMDSGSEKVRSKETNEKQLYESVFNNTIGN